MSRTYRFLHKQWAVLGAFFNHIEGHHINPDTHLNDGASACIASPIRGQGVADIGLEENIAGSYS